MWATSMRSRKQAVTDEAGPGPVIGISHEAALRLADRDSTGYDFGHGEVAARRHRNPDRSLGGWVADTAHADAEAFVAPDAVVFGNARVFGACLILGRARVFDFARVNGGSVVADDSQVSESAIVTDAVIGDSAVVSGSARVQGGVVRGGALVTDSARVNGGAVVQDRAEVRGLAFVTEGAIVTGETVVEGAVRGDVIVLDASIEATEDLAAAPGREPVYYVAAHAALDDAIDHLEFDVDVDELVEPDEEITGF